MKIKKTILKYFKEDMQPCILSGPCIIRGINSAGGSSELLILIDGKRTLDDVDTNDIESFSVLHKKYSICDCCTQIIF